MYWLDEVKKRYPDARHHCWAYLLGNPACATNAGMGDDGEPSGTAGKPILNVLQHKDVGDVMIIVVRYFGGIKLGAGGLTRAYSQAAQSVMTELPIKQHIHYQAVDIFCDYAQEQLIRHKLSLLEGKVSSVVYTNPIHIEAAIPSQAFADLRLTLASLANTRLSVRES